MVGRVGGFSLGSSISIPVFWTCEMKTSLSALSLRELTLAYKSGTLLIIIDLSSLTLGITSFSVVLGGVWWISGVGCIWIGLGGIWMNGSG